MNRFHAKAAAVAALLVLALTAVDGRGVDLQITINSATRKNDMDKPYVDVVLSSVAAGPGATNQTSRYTGEIPETERRVLPASKHDGYKIYTSPTMKGKHGKRATWDDTIVLRNVPDTASITFRVWDSRKLIWNEWLGDAVLDVKTLPIARGSTKATVRDFPLHSGKRNKRVGHVKVTVSVLGRPKRKDAALATRREGPIKWRRYDSKAVEMYVNGVKKALTSGDQGYYVYSVDLHNIEKIFGSVRKPGVAGHPTIRKANRSPFFEVYTNLRHSVLNNQDPGEAGELKDARGFFDLFNWGRGGKRFTFVVRDGFIRFSETGYPHRLDEISKHFVLNDGNRDVVFSGEMFVVPDDRLPASARKDVKVGKKYRDRSQYIHRSPKGTCKLRRPFAAARATHGTTDPRLRHMTHPPSLRKGTRPVPEGTTLPVLVIDNGSGTYAPSAKFLPLLRKLIHSNFPDMKVLAIDQFDSRMKDLKRAAGVPIVNPAQPNAPPFPAEGHAPGSPMNPQGTHVVLPTGTLIRKPSQMTTPAAPTPSR